MKPNTPFSVNGIPVFLLQECPECGTVSAVGDSGCLNSELCPDCFQIAEIENSYSDGDITREEFILKLANIRKKLGINDTDKVASTLAGTNFSPNDYHQSIRETARILVDLSMGDWKYCTQWGSGTCVYWSPDKRKSVSVNPNTGEVNY